MGSISAIVSDLEYSRSELLKSIEGLSERELTEIPVYDGWTIKEVLAHIIGWDQRVIKTLPLILQDRASEIPGVDVEEHNRQSVEMWRDKSITRVLAEIKATHQQIIDILSSIDHVEIDKRHQRNGRVITIRSYVIDIMTEHERRHAFELAQWRKRLDQAIDPTAIKLALEQKSADFMSLLDQVEVSQVIEKGGVGIWSVSDLVGHVADWQQRMLKAAYHIYDPSLPTVPPLSDSIDDWNEIMADNRADKTWAENYHYLHETQRATHDFLVKLKPGDYKLRGPYPWPDDQGNLAGLLVEMTEHYEDHLPDLERWLSQRGQAQTLTLKPWIRWLYNNEATGLLRKEYDAAIKRAGKIWNIVRVMSLNPAALQASMRLYGSVVHRSTERLGRPEREMIAVVVSQANHCHY